MKTTPTTAAIKQIHNLGAKVLAIPDGDVAGNLCFAAYLMLKSIFLMELVAVRQKGVGWALIRSLGGDMQARLIPRNEVKGDTEKKKKFLANDSTLVQHWA